MKQTLLILVLCCWGSLFLKGQSINSVVPNQSPVLSGTILTVNISGSGTNFTAGSSTYVTAMTNNGLLYGQINQSTVTNTNLEVDFYVHCGVCGAVDLSVTTPIDGSMNYANAFSVSCPQITAVSPNTGSSGQSLSVGISGTNINFTQGSSTYLYFYNNSTGQYIYPSGYNGGTLDSTNINLNIPANSCGGSYDLVVYSNSNNSCSAFFPNALNVTGPQITAVTPNTGNSGQSLSVGISGANIDFTQGSNTYLYFYNNSTGQSIYPSGYNGGTSDSTNINLNIPTNSCGGSYDLIIYSNNGCSAVLPNAFNVTSNLGQITMVNPDTIQPGQTLPIQISGTGVDFTQGSLTVFFRNTISGNTYYPSNYNSILTNSVTVDFSAPNAACAGDYDVCLRETASSCPICFSSGLYIDTPAVARSITNVTAMPSSQVQGGQPLTLSISGTGIDFTQGSGLYVYLVNSGTNNTVGTSTQTPNPLNPNQMMVTFNSIPYDCGTYDLKIYDINACNGGLLVYPNAVTVTSTLNPELVYAIPAPAPSQGQLRLRLSGLDIDFTQGSSMLSVRLISPSTGAILTGSNLLPASWSSANAIVDFSPTASQCGYYNLEISNVPTGCGGTTTVTYSRLIGVNIANCGNNTPFQTVLNTHSVRSTPITTRPRVNSETNTPIGVDDLQILNDSKLGSDQLSVQAFPNPMNQHTSILVQGESQQVLNFALYDMLGQVVKQTSFKVNETLSINRDNLPAGMYVYRVLDATGKPLHVGKLEMQ
ncbi:MAG: T9SS type A sorting domain-containing protein [Aureispira sp.]